MIDTRIWGKRVDARFPPKSVTLSRNILENHIDRGSYRLEQNLLPLTEATFYILLSLSAGRKHGYAILKDVSALSDATLELSTSTLYGALGRLQDQGLIERVENGPGTEVGPGLPRKAYQLTDLGRRMLEAEMTRLRRLVQAGVQRLGQEPQA